MKKKSQFSKLDELLPKALNKFNIAAPVQAAQVVNRWHEVASRILKIGDPGMALYVKDGTLTIGVTNSSLAQTIQMQKKELLKELNTLYPKTRVKEIRCKHL